MEGFYNLVHTCQWKGATVRKLLELERQYFRDAASAEPSGLQHLKLWAQLPPPTSPPLDPSSHLLVPVHTPGASARNQGPPFAPALQTSKRTSPDDTQRHLPPRMQRCRSELSAPGGNVWGKLRRSGEGGREMHRWARLAGYETNVFYLISPVMVRLS